MGALTAAPGREGAFDLAAYPERNLAERVAAFIAAEACDYAGPKSKSGDRTQVRQATLISTLCDCVKNRTPRPKGTGSDPGHGAQPWQAGQLALRRPA